MYGLRTPGQCSASVFIGLALAMSLSVSAVAAPSASMHTYPAAGGQTFFALSLSPEVDVSAAGGRDVVLLLDTSASQAGVYRETAMAALQACLDKLGRDDHVRLVAVDLDARSLTDGFVSPQGPAISSAVDAIQLESPLGSTDMERALRSSVAMFDEGAHGPDARERVVLYIGDGRSTANLLGTETFRQLVQRLVQSRVSVSSYAIGPERDNQLLAALANQTGGNLYVDEPMAWADDQQGISADRARAENIRRGESIGTMMADWVRATVLWPQQVGWPAELGEVYPSAVPPLRTDRDTIVVGASQGPLDGAVQIELTVQATGQDRQLSWTAKPQVTGDDYAFLSQLVELARSDGGVTLPTVGSAGLQETGRMINANIDGLTNLAQRAVATGDFGGAQLLSQAVLRQDPGNLRAQNVERAANRARQATPVQHHANSQAAPSAGPDDLSLVRVAQAPPLPPGAAPPGEGELAFPAEGSLVDRFADEGSFMGEVEEQKQVFAQMLRREVENTVREARSRMADEPDMASQQLKLALQNVERAPELNAEVRASLVDVLQSALQEVQRSATLKDELDRAREEEIAAARERRMLVDRLAREREKEKQLMDRFASLMDERRYGEAQEVAAIVEEIDPEGVTPRVAMVSSRFMHHNYLQQVTRAARWQAFFDTMYQVELSSIPFPDDPPIVYPDAPVWEELTNRRKKYASVDLSARGGAEERINSALASPLTSLGLDFPDTPLEEIVNFIQNEYDIPIQIDTQALLDVGLGPDEPVTINVRNITLRSAMRLLLNQVDLTYIIKDEVLQITTPEEADTALTVKVYPVADLVIPIQIPNIGGGGGGGLGGGGGGGGLGGGGGGFGGGGGGFGGGGGGGGFGGGGGGFGGGGFFSVPDKEADNSNQSAIDSDPPKPAKRSIPRSAQKRATGIEIDEALAPEAFWSGYFQQTREPKTVRQAVRELMGAGRTDHVIALIQAALRHGQPQPWMYESLGIAMELSGRSTQQIERAVMSAADFSTGADELMYIAQYLSRIGLDSRALSLYQQVVKVDPLRLEAYSLGLRAAQRLEDLSGIQWATVGILSQAWPSEQSVVPQTAMRVVRSTLAKLDAQGRTAERDAYQQQLQEALVRDCIVRVRWTGDADVDLLVEEPGGTVCSQNLPRTTGGGMYLGDDFAAAKSDSNGSFHEAYVCPQGFSGTYRARIRRVWGDVTAGKVTVDVYRNYGTDNVEHERQQIEVGKDDAIVLFDLQSGRRAAPLEAEQLAGAVRRQQQISQAVLAQQIDQISDAGIIPSRRIFDRRRRLALGRGAVGFQPVITTLPEGTNFVVTGVVSADRRYVRITALPFFSTIGNISTFTFAGRSENADDDNGGDGGDGGG